MPLDENRPDAGNRFNKETVRPQSPSSAARRALHDSIHGHLVSVSALQLAVEGYVRQLKRDGTRVEDIILAVKSFVKSEVPEWAESPDGPLPADWTFIDRAVQWAVEYYYASGDGEDEQSQRAG